MPRLSRSKIMEQNKELISQTFLSLNQSIFTFTDITDILGEYRKEWSLPNITSVNELIIFLLKNKIVEHVDIDLPTRTADRYIVGNPSIYELSLTINKKAYLSHYTALFLHGLTNNVPKIIYTNFEQTNKNAFRSEGELVQKNIDLAFSRPMRTTNQIGDINFRDTKYQVYLLNGKNHNRLGVSEILVGQAKLAVTDIERTLIDITVRPNYAGGMDEVLDAFKLAKGRFSVNKLIVMLKKMNFIYPYHQLLGFYLEQAGYDEDLLKLFEQFDIKYNFYLSYQMRDKEFSDRWKVYYPKGFIQKNN